MEQVVEEEKYTEHKSESKQSQIVLGAFTLTEMHTNSFVSPTESDYIDCQHTYHNINNCNVISRILTLLIHYQQNENTDMYGYMSSFNNYTIHTFMDDWHHAKNNHLREEKNVITIRNNVNIACKDMRNCEYFQRYQRERGSEIYNEMKIETDIKNIILKDKLDSIHVFIFHSAERKNARNVFRNIRYKYDNNISENKDNDEQKQYIWDHIPQATEDFTAKQILWIINNGVFDDLTEKHRTNLKPFESKIIKYIEENKIDGKMLHEMNRKHFMKMFAEYLQNKKLKISLGALYNSVIKYDLSRLPNNHKNTETTHKPQSIQQCNTHQIATIANNIIVNTL
eukprot:85960_1